MRLSQILSKLTFTEVFYTEDEALLEAIKKCVEECVEERER